MRNLFRALVVTMGLAAFAPRADAGNVVVSFPSGSLVIPASASFQSDCGAVSMYGVVYDVLRANVWLAANGYEPITFYYAIADGTATAWSALGKQSPNRCTPSNLDTPPSVDPSWTDGCDFQITNATGPLVTLIDNAHASIAADDSPLSTYATTGKSYVWPQYATQPLAAATTISYMGGPMIIKNDAPNGKTLGSQSATFLALLDGTLVANDSAGNAIDFSPFTSPVPSSSGACSFGNDNYVNVHRSLVPFSASINKSFNATPPRLALLDSGGGGAGPPPPPPKFNFLNNTAGRPHPSCTSPWGATESGYTATFTTTAPHGFAAGDQVTIAGVSDHNYNGTYTVLAVPAPTSLTFAVTLANNHVSNSCAGTVTGAFVTEPATKNISGGILAKYLNDAGLSFPGAQGCPTGGANVGNTGVCPIGGNPGQIYDAFDFADLVNNKLVLTDSGVPRYSMIWTPHWDTTADGSTPPNASEITALSYMKSFLDGQTGLFAECAAVTSYEGGYEGGTAKVEGSIPSTGGMQLQSCVNSSGSCSATANAFGFARNMATAPTGTLRNCSDITTLDGSMCAYFAYPQDPFSQVADYAFIPTGGTTHDWNPNPASPASMYRPGVLTLVSGVHSLVRANLTSSALMRSSGQVVTDWFTRSVKDNTPGKGNIAYLGGHDLTNEVSATKLVLQTLLQLGTSVVPTPPTVIEVSRASPVVASLNGAPAIVQGSFESVTPPAVATVIALDADVTGWTFPTEFGHMRATVAASPSITTTAQVFGASTATVLFDAAGGIPTVSNTGCATPFNGQCRSVFTTTQTSPTGIVLNPPNVFLTDANAPTLGLLMQPGLLATSYVTMVEKILAGQPDGFGGFIPRLGGVDRSTVAVIEPSTIAGTSRPTMAYFGATDGMLHAVCAVRQLPACDTAGRELWAFMPRTQLPFVRLNTTRIDGSPHVADVFGKFHPTETGKSFHTILTFQTGSGQTLIGSTPAVFALDITDPTAPSVIWEYTIPSAPGLYEVGTGLAMAGGVVNIGGTSVNVAFAETNNGGTGGNGVVVSGINLETGAQVWKFHSLYGGLYTGGDTVIPTSGIPGGAVAVDKTGQGYTTDVVFGDLYGRLWEINPVDSTSRYTSAGPVDRPLFEYTADYHPIGSMPAIYSNGTKQFAVAVPGGFDDPADSWGLVTLPPQVAVSVDLTTPNAVAQLTQASPTTYVPFQISLGVLGGKNLAGSAQALVVNNELFITSDNSDINKATYGLGAQTGSVQQYNIGTLAITSTTTVAGGAGSLANVGSTIYSSSANQQQQMANGSTTSAAPSVDSGMMPKLTRNLWLRTL